MQYCRKCILNEKIPFITFDEFQICNYCHEQNILQTKHKADLYLNKNDLDKLLGNIRGKNTYDCIVAVSGGKDSIGALYIVKKILNLNPLALTFSNCFLTNSMIENIQEAVQILGVDWRLYHYDKIKKGFEYFIKSPFKKQMSICDVCDLFFSPISIANTIAKNEKIKIIFTGSTIAQRIGKIPKEIMPPIHQKYYQRYKKVIENIKNYLEQFDELKNIMPCDTNNNSALITSPWYYFDQKLLRIDEILKSLNWKKTELSFPKNSTNCKLSYLTGYFGRKYGVPNYDITFSRLIRFNEITRQEAFDRFLTPIPESLIKNILSELNLSINDL